MTSIDRDGTRSGFDTDLLRAIIVAGRRAGHRVGRRGRTRRTSSRAVRDGGADAVLAASIFHRRIHSIADVKAAMAAAGLPVRLVAAGRGMTPRRAARRPPSASAPTASSRRSSRTRADGRVLMVAYMDAEALAATIATGEVHFHSRSRDRLWRKGETSGNVLRLRRTRADCDGDALLVTVEPAGPTCHRGHAELLRPRRARPPTARARGSPGSRRCGRRSPSAPASGPAGSYTTSLLEGGVDAAGRKVTEEATEVLLAAKDDAAAERGRRRPRRPRATALAGEAGRPAVPRARAARRAGRQPGRRSSTCSASRHRA